MNITGKLTRNENGAITGHVASLTFDVDVALSDNPFKSAEKHPDFIISARSPRGREIRIGSAWEMTSRAGNKYLSLAISGPGATIRANALRLADDASPEATSFEIVEWAD